MTDQTDPATLRDRIAEALLDHLSRTADIRRDTEGELAFMPVVTDDERMRLTDAVLSVLPTLADRAAEWRAAADHIEAMRGYPSVMVPEEAVEELRRMADETQQPEAGRCCGKPAGAICVHDVPQQPKEARP